MNRSIVLATLLALMLMPPAAAAPAGGGRIRTPDGIGIGGVSVVIIETSTVQTTDNSGHYAFHRVPEGT